MCDKQKIILTYFGNSYIFVCMFVHSIHLTNLEHLSHARGIPSLY